MGQDEGTGGAGVTGSRDPEQIREEIDQTREALGDTVQALAAKTDVKAQLRERVQGTKQSVLAKKNELAAQAKQTSPDGALSAASQASRQARENPVPVAIVAVIVAGLLARRLLRR